MATIREVSKRFGINLPQEVWPSIVEADKKAVKEKSKWGLYNVGIREVYKGCVSET